MKKIITASFLASVVMAGSAFAQTTTPDAGATDPAMQTQGTAPATDTGMAAGQADMGMMNEGGFITYQEGSQLLGSGLMGADVQGPDGESIGTVDDLLLDRDGQVQAVIVGVGGFLGIGTKDVAIANDQLEFVLAQDAAANEGTVAGDAATATGGATAPAAPAGGAMTATESTTTPGTMTTGTDMGMAADAEADERYGWSGAGIDHIRVSYTREQLEEAPEFESAE